MRDPMSSYKAFDRPHPLPASARVRIAETMRNAYADELELLETQPNTRSETVIELDPDSSPRRNGGSSWRIRIGLSIAAGLALIAGVTVTYFDGPEGESVTAQIDQEVATQVESYCQDHIEALALALDSVRVNPTAANVAAAVSELEQAVAGVDDLAGTVAEPHADRASFAFDALTGALDDLPESSTPTVLEVEVVASDLAAALTPFPGAGGCRLNRLDTRQEPSNAFYDGYRPDGG